MTALPDNDLTDELAARVREAAATKTPLRIVGGDNKRFYGRDVQAATLALDRHTGILHYDPAELVVAVRAGTPPMNASSSSRVMRRAAIVRRLAARQGARRGPGPGST